MLGYALGREVNRVDMCVVQDCVAALETGRVSRLALAGSDRGELSFFASAIKSEC